ncbi:MAG: HNH endonuclease signature motif containing protein [Anaerolineae bacterium]|jgi:hypothetical protein
MTPSPYIPLSLREIVITRALGCCEYCQTPARYSPEVFEVEHIWSLSAGGTTTLSNLALACPACNRYKGRRQNAIDPQTMSEVALFNPRTQIWTDHFRWSNDLREIIGLTAAGRATVITLRMNRSAVLIFRSALSLAGLHPAMRAD